MTVFNTNKISYYFGKKMIFIAIALFIIAVGIMLALKWAHPQEIYGFKISTIINTLDIIAQLDGFFIFAISLEYWLTTKIEIDELTGNLSITKPNQQNPQIYSPNDLKEFKFIYSDSDTGKLSIVILTKTGKEIDLHVSNFKKQQIIIDALLRYSHLRSTTEPYTYNLHDFVKSGIAAIQKATDTPTKVVVILILLIGWGIIMSFLYYYGK